MISVGVREGGSQQTLASPITAVVSGSKDFPKRVCSLRHWTLGPTATATAACQSVLAPGVVRPVGSWAVTPTPAGIRSRVFLFIFIPHPLHSSSPDSRLQITE
jgi:hypothetical protein